PHAVCAFVFFFFSSRRRHTRSTRDWSSDVCSSDLVAVAGLMFLLALQPEPAGISSDRSDSHARALILSDQARRYLTLQYRSFPRSEERRVGKESRARWSHVQ